MAPSPVAFFASACATCHLHHPIVCRLFRNIEDIQKLSELGVLFLLFEMGLELSLDRLKASPPIAATRHYR